MTPRSRVATLGAVLLGALVVAPASASAAESLPQLRLTPIGAPGWKPVDAHMFSAPIGTAASGYAEFTATMLGVLPAPNHRLHPQLGVGPGVPHQPPYDQEIRDGVAALGFDERAPFTRRQFSDGNGVWLAWMNAPAPGTRGSSPDFGSGPIITNSLFPVTITGFSTHRGARYSTLAEFSVPKLDGLLTPPFAVDGHSHFPIFIADNTDFGPPGANPLGAYAWHLRMLDQGGNGWQLELHFEIRP